MFGAFQVGGRRARLDFSSGSVGKGEYIFAGALALIIILSLVGALLMLMGPNGPEVERDPNIHLECTRCGHQWTVARQTEQEGPEGGPPPSIEMMNMGGMGMDCTNPDCFAEGAAFTQIKCLKCEEYYLQDEALRNPNMQAPGGDMPTDTCKLCGANQNELRREMIKKRRGR